MADNDRPMCRPGCTKDIGHILAGDPANWVCSNETPEEWLRRLGLVDAREVTTGSNALPRCVPPAPAPLRDAREVELKRWLSGFVTSARVTEDHWIQLASTNQAGTRSVRLRLDPQEYERLGDFIAGVRRRTDVARAGVASMVVDADRSTRQPDVEHVERSALSGATANAAAVELELATAKADVERLRGLLEEGAHFVEAFCDYNIDPGLEAVASAWARQAREALK